MIEYKRISFKYVVLAFLIAAFLIILLSVDRKNNEAPPIEDVFIEELFKPELERVKTSAIHEVKDGENLSIIFEVYRVPLNNIYKIGQIPILLPKRYSGYSKMKLIDIVFGFFDILFLYIKNR